MHNPNIRSLDLNLLVVFDAIADSGSVSRAAERLNMSQPAVSHALNRLREQTGDPLFVRDRRGLARSPRAEAMAPLVRDMLQNAQEAFAPSNFDAATTSETFRVAASDYAVMVLGPQLVRRVRASAPAAKLQFRAPDANLARSLESGELDLAFVGAEAPRGAFSSEVLFHESMIGVFRARHPLAAKARRGRLTLDEYLAFPHAVVQFEFPGLNPFGGRLDELGRKRRVSVTTSNFFTNFSALLGADLVAALPSRLGPVARRLGLVTFAIPLKMEEFSYLMVWHRRVDADPKSIWLRHTAKLAARRGRQFSA